MPAVRRSTNRVVKPPVLTEKTRYPVRPLSSAHEKLVAGVLMKLMPPNSDWRCLCTCPVSTASTRYCFRSLRISPRAGGDGDHQAGD
jgi:hypothetical protein